MTAEYFEQPVETCFPPSRFMNLSLSQQRFKALAAVSFFYELTNSIILFILRFSELKVKEFLTRLSVRENTAHTAGHWVLPSASYSRTNTPGSPGWMNATLTQTRSTRCSFLSKRVRNNPCSHEFIFVLTRLQ